MNKEKILKISEDCIFEELDKELFMLNINSGQYYEINEIGSKLLKVIYKNKVNFYDLCDFIKEEFNSRSIDTDIEEFLLQAINKEIIKYEQ